MRTKLQVLGVFLCAMLLCAPGWGADIRVGAPADATSLIRDAAALFVAETGLSVHVQPYAHEDMMSFASAGDVDVLVAPCNHSGDSFEENGYVVPATRRGLFCRRMSIITAPANPKNVIGIEDLGRPDLRWGKIAFCSWRGENLLKGREEAFNVTSEDAGLMMDLLERGEIDAILGWDTDILGHTLNPVVLRLPCSRHGDSLAAMVPAFVSPRAADAAARLVSFLAENVHVTDLYLAAGLMTDDGSDAGSYDTTAATRFEPVYRNIVQQVIDDYGIVNGAALDIGCGPGRMTTMLAEMTDLDVTGLDIEPEAVEIGRGHASDAGLSARLHFVAADAHSLPFADESFDLVISRGTLPFLRDQAKVMREVYRVLRPGGVAFLGGGMGRYTPREQARALYPKGVAPQTALDWGPGESREDSIFPFPVRSFDALMTKAGISSYSVVNEGGRWVEIRK